MNGEEQGGMRIPARLACLVLLLVAVPSLAQQQVKKFQWMSDKSGGGWVLNGFDWTQGFNEQDTLVRFACRRGGKIEIGIGADLGIGKGRGEAVVMSARSGFATVRIEGVSRKSENFEMTSGIELVKAGVDANDPLIELLKLEGSATLKQEPNGKSFTFPAKGFSAALAKFLKGCGLA
jgi:hypothetical protein